MKALMKPGKTWISFYQFLSSLRVIWITIVGVADYASKVICFSFPAFFPPFGCLACLAGCLLDDF